MNTYTKVIFIKGSLRLCFFLLSLLLSLTAFSQNEATKWYFGNMAGLDFMTNPPTVLTNGTMNTSEGCASIADGAGNLLFYTNGNSVWNQTGSVMANGSNLAGYQYGSQSSLIVKQPGSATLYYIFTTSINNGFCYSIVDMSLAAGNGSVTVKNFTVAGTLYSEKLSAVKHCNGTDIWIVTHDGSYYNTITTPNFYAYQLTSAGVNTTAVVSPANNAWANTAYYGYFDYGCMKISSNGRKLALAIYGNWNYTTTANVNTVELYDFNALTGVVSNSLGLNPWVTTNINYYNESYGCEFSPDGTKLYASTPYYNNAVYSSAGILQWDLCAGSNTAIAASQYTVILNGTAATPYYFTSLQLAPNGKIYAAKISQYDLGVINNPNLAGAACNFAPSGQSIAPRMGYDGLPNFMSSYLPTAQTLTPFTYSINTAVSCLTPSFTAPSTVSLNCAAAANNVTGWYWLFGDPASGAANSSTLTNPAHTYSAPGTYTVKLAYNYTCGSDTVSLPISIIGTSLTITTSSITCATLGSATVSASGGTGPYSYTWMPTAQTTSVATGLNPGNYSLTVVDNGGNCAFTATTSFASLVPFTGLLSNSSSIPCNGVGTGTADISLAGGSGNQTYAWISPTGTQTTATAAGLGAGTHTIIVIDALTSCAVTQFFIINQPPPMSLQITASSPSTCAGTSISFTVANSGGTPGTNPAYTYTWTGGPVSNTYTAAQATAGNYTYTVNSRDGNNCLATQTVLAAYIVNPTVSVSSISICPLETGTLIASGATSYTWNSSGPVSNTFAASPTANTAYTVVGSAAGCTSTPVTASMVIKPIPTPTVSNNSPVCNGQNLALSALGGTAYVWSGPQSFASALQNPTVNPAAPANSGVYNLTVTAANSCTAATSTTVTVHPTPTISVAGSTVCVNQTLSLTAGSFAGAGFVWNGPLSFTSALQSPTLANAATNMTGSYTLTVTSQQGCTNTAMANASVVAMPVPVITPNYTALCSGALLTLSGSGGAGYSWSGPNGFSSSLPSTSLPGLSLSSAGAYTLLVTTGPCAISATQAIVVYALPSPTAASLPTCETASLQINAGLSNSTASPYLYSWSGPLGFNSINQSPLFSPVLTDMAGTYSLTVTDGHNCQSSITTQVVVLLNPTVTATGTTVCLGQHAVLVADGAQSYVWSGPSGYTSSSQFAFIPVAGSTLAQPYFVIGTAANSCTAPAVAILQTDGLPNPSLLVTPKACLNSTISLQGFGGGTYQWAGPYNFSSNQQDVLLVVSNAEYSGTYTLTVTNGAGCTSYTTANVQIDPVPEGDLVNNIANNCVPFCADFSLKLKSPNAITSTLWQLGGQGFNSPGFNYCISEPGRYLVNGTFTDVIGCVNTATYEIMAYPLPQAGFEFEPKSPVEGFDQVQFTNTSSGLQLSKWSWYFMDNGGYKATTANTNYVFEKAGTYVVSMVVKNTWGCADTVVKPITVEPDFYIYVPNSFTPNSDDKNDVFQPKGSGVVKYDLVIYDRWGSRVFQSSEFTKGWDGSFQGQDCKMEVYVWKITASDKHGKTKNLNGFVTLYR